MTEDSHTPQTSTTHRFRDLSKDKLRGGYYTPHFVADWMSHWAIRSSSEHVLEPSCGDGAFIQSVANTFLQLGCPPQSVAEKITAVELIPEEAAKAQIRLSEIISGTYCDKHTILNYDFFDFFVKKSLLVDVVIGNPPYIRYQSFPENSRNTAMKIMEDYGLKANRLTNIWVPFVVASVVSLKNDGRLAFVLPAELLQVSYAAQLRDFLIKRFKRIAIVTCNELIFPNAEQEVVLLLADGCGLYSENHECQVSIIETDNIQGILNIPPENIFKVAEQKKVRHAEEKWLKFFLSSQEIDFMRALKFSKRISPLSLFASINVGVVTGKNDFFLFSPIEVERRHFNDYVIPIVSKSAHLPGSILSDVDWISFQDKKTAKVYLLYLNEKNENELSSDIIEYLHEGEKQNVHTGYKCSIRKPWYFIPSVSVPQGFMFRQIYDFPRIVKNTINATSTDTIHRLTTMFDPEVLFPNFYTYLTAASAEIEGRSYGGGVLELEPKEASKLLVPSQICPGVALSDIDAYIRKGKLEEIIDKNSKIILQDGLGFSCEECQMLKQIWKKLRTRRAKRGKATRK